MDAYSREYSVHNSLNYRNLTVRSSGSGESGTIRSNTHGSRRDGLRTLLARRSGKFGIDSVHGTIRSGDFETEASFHKVHRNISRRPTDSSTLSQPVFNNNHDNLFLTSLIPRSDYQYGWVTCSLGKDFSLPSGKQRVYGYTPKSGLLEETTVVESSIYFDGTARIAFGSHTTWDAIIGDGGTSKFSISLWVKRQGANHERLLTFGSMFFALNINASGHIGFYQEWDNNVSWFTADPDTVPVGVWTHIGLTYDAGSTSNTPSVYINGKGPLTVSDYGVSPSGTWDAIEDNGLTNNQMYIAYNPGNAFNVEKFFTGHIKNLAIWSEIISAANMYSIYELEETGDPSDVVSSDLELYYILALVDRDGLPRDSVNAIYDHSGNSRTATETLNLTIEKEEEQLEVEAIVFPSASEIFGV